MIITLSVAGHNRMIVNSGAELLHVGQLYSIAKDLIVGTTYTLDDVAIKFTRDTDNG